MYHKFCRLDAGKVTCARQVEKQMDFATSEFGRWISDNLIDWQKEHDCMIQ